MNHDDRFSVIGRRRKARSENEAAHDNG
jgi:hypothetical protein